MNEVWDSQAVGDETTFNWDDFANRGFDSLDRWLGRYGGSGYYSPTYPNDANRPDVGVNISIWVWVLIAIGLLVFLKGKR